MKKGNVKRAAIVAALFLVAIIFSIFALTTSDETEIQPMYLVPAATSQTAKTKTITPPSYMTPYSFPSTSSEALHPTVAPNASESRALFTLTIKEKNISVAYGVDEETLDKTPGWLPSSALPGQDGMCVVYGHRNRTHLRVLEKVRLGDSITITARDGNVYTYTISDIQIYTNMDSITLSAVDEKTLVIMTCYPFRYSGNAPKKIVITSIC